MAYTFVKATPSYFYSNTRPVDNYPFTMACWFLTSNATANQYLISISFYSGGVNAPYYGLIAGGASTNDPILVRADNGPAADYALSTTGYSTNTWHHAAGVWTSSDSRAAYIDGGSKGTNTTSVTWNNAIEDMSLANLYRSDNPDVGLDGQIAEAAIWNVALTDGEIAMLAKGFAPPLIRSGNLVSYWPLVRSTIDYAGRIPSFTAVNSPTVSAHPRVLHHGMAYPPFLATASTPPSPGTTTAVPPIAVNYFGRRGVIG